ncbi:MAG: MBOAT family protein [Bacteroidia bacterium]|nr:MBOAT family protein [Bacteroidia bacterium]
MVFSSSLFILYFLPLALLAYYFIDRKYKNLVIVAFSIFFYAWGAPKYLFMVLAAMIMDFFFANQIYKSQRKAKKYYLVAALSINIGLLLYFKYFNFFTDNVNEMLSIFGFQQHAFMKVALPVGISFFTFHEMSFLIDVYRNVKKPLKSITDYALYILFFPQLIAGPIIRFNEIADQIENRGNNENIDNRLTGFFRFVIGLSKKVLIANVLGKEADIIFSLPADQLTTPLAWIGTLAYTFQIYFDFSGYSDMAIGIARMMGFIFPENFNNPYISRNITELWRRWHMTLSRWMRDYLYFSLGGNRVNSKARLYFNLALVFIISGFWHGAAWNFVIWGAFHGFFLILDRIFLIKWLDKIGKWPSIAFTFLLTMIGWVFFRSETLMGALGFLKKMFYFDGFTLSNHFSMQFWAILVVAILLSFSTSIKLGLKLESKLYATSHNLLSYSVMTVLCISFLMISLGSITSSGFNPFIYFRF